MPFAPPEWGPPSADAQEFADRLEVPSQVLEIGPGHGFDAMYLARQGHDVTALDVSPALLECLCAWSQGAVTVVEHNLEQPLPLEAATFDAVYARLSIHYFTDAVTRQVLTEIARILRPSGFLMALCKSHQDGHYGHGVEIETDMFELNGHVRRFFSLPYAWEVLTASGEFTDITVAKRDLATAGDGRVVLLNGRKHPSRE